MTSNLSKDSKESGHPHVTLLLINNLRYLSLLEADLVSVDASFIQVLASHRSFTVFVSRLENSLPPHKRNANTFENFMNHFVSYY